MQALCYHKNSPMPSTSALDVIFSVAVLIMSVVVHEVSHGYAAYLQGDPTARLQGRLTLNPLKHLDPMGSIVIPLVSYALGGFIIGWAKPVPFNPYNLRNQRWGELLVAIAGPISNFSIALVFALLIRLSVGYAILPLSFTTIAATVVLVNLMLAVFNLIPIPPLDGSKILFSVLPLHLRGVRVFLERYALLLALLFILVFWRFLFPIVLWLFVLLTGLNL